ncbi:MAG: alpha/beta hydrolase [Chloroflexaceae bacterium]
MGRSTECISNVQAGEVQGAMQPLLLSTSRGVVPGRFYPASRSTRCGAIWVGGVGGGWDTPADDLYPRLCEQFVDRGITSLRIQFRDPRSLPEAVFDVRVGVSYLQERGIDRIALTGHSFGGAVVIQAAVAEPAVRTVVTLATQSYGVDAVLHLAPGCSLLLLHGTADPVLSPRCSEYTYGIANEPKQLILYPDAGHVLDEVADEIHPVVSNWITRELGCTDAPGGQ